MPHRSHSSVMIDQIPYLKKVFFKQPYEFWRTFASPKFFDQLLLFGKIFFAFVFGFIMGRMWPRNYTASSNWIHGSFDIQFSIPPTHIFIYGTACWPGTGMCS